MHRATSIHAQGQTGRNGTVHSRPHLAPTCPVAATLGWRKTHWHTLQTTRSMLIGRGGGLLPRNDTLDCRNPTHVVESPSLHSSANLTLCFFFFLFSDPSSVGVASSPPPPPPPPSAAFLFLSFFFSPSSGASNALARSFLFSSVLSACCVTDVSAGHPPDQARKTRKTQTLARFLSSSFSLFAFDERKYSPDSNCKSTFESNEPRIQFFLQKKTIIEEEEKTVPLKAVEPAGRECTPSSSPCPSFSSRPPPLLPLMTMMARPAPRLSSEHQQQHHHRKNPNRRRRRAYSISAW
jgi:hypothetical protein